MISESFQRGISMPKLISKDILSNITDPLMLYPRLELSPLPSSLALHLLSVSYGSYKQRYLNNTRLFSTLMHCGRNLRRSRMVH